MNPDMVNGLFEIFGAAVLCLNVKAIRSSKTVRGMNPWTTVFFTSWGIWNLYYYPSLDQWFSFWGGVAIVVVNGVWLAHVAYYYNEHRKLKRMRRRIL